MVAQPHRAGDCKGDTSFARLLKQILPKIGIFGGLLHRAIYLPKRLEAAIQIKRHKQTVCLRTELRNRERCQLFPHHGVQCQHNVVRADLPFKPMCQCGCHSFRLRPDKHGAPVARQKRARFLWLRQNPGKKARVPHDRASSNNRSTMVFMHPPNPA